MQKERRKKVKQQRPFLLKKLKRFNIFTNQITRFDIIYKHRTFKKTQT